MKNVFRWDLDLDLYRMSYKPKLANMVNGFSAPDSKENWKTLCKKEPNSDIIKKILLNIDTIIMVLEHQMILMM